MREHNVTLYMKDGCHLCERARELLVRFDGGGSYGRLNISEVEINSDPALFERYKYVIPVIEIDERAHLEAPISAADLRAALEMLS
jgi:glutaredoxin